MITEGSLAKATMIQDLRAQILRLQGFKEVDDPGRSNIQLGLIARAFPTGTIPLACIHEFIVERKESRASTCAFVNGLLSTVKLNNGAIAWISSSRNLFPPAFKMFGVEPDQVIFIAPKRSKDTLWAMEEALKCNALTTVVCETTDVSFMESRRLQLAVEESKVTGFLVRQVQKANTTSCVSRWRISPQASDVIDNLPGIGFPKWKVELLRVRNGKPGTWIVSWNGEQFNIIETISERLHQSDSSTSRKAG